jgi:FixJ family two-component response regulator
MCPTTVQAMKAGAVEFLTKPFRRRRAVERHPARHRAQPRRTRSREAEMQVLRDLLCVTHRLANGRSWRSWPPAVLNKQVGGELGISEITVKATSRPR